MGELYFQATCRRAVASGEGEIKDSEDMSPLDESIREITMSVKKGEITFKFLEEGYVASYDYRSKVPTDQYTLDTFTLKYYGFIDVDWDDVEKQKFNDKLRLFAGEDYVPKYKNRVECKESINLGHFYFAETAEIIIPGWKIRIDQEFQLRHLNKFLDKNVTKSLLKITDSSPNDLEITVVQSANPHRSFSHPTENPPDDPNEEKNAITQNPITQNMYIIQRNIY